MPRLTRLPGRSSSATRFAMSSLSSMTTIHFDDVIHEHMRGYDVIGRNDTRRNDLSRLDDDSCGGRGHNRVEVACRQRVIEVASVIAAFRRDQREFGLEWRLEEEIMPINFDGALALGNRRADPSRCQNAAKPVASRPNALGQRSLRAQFG